MKSITIFQQLRKLDVPIEKARAVAEKYGVEDVPTTHDRARAAIEREARRIRRETERRKFKLWCVTHDLPLPVFEHVFAPPRKFPFDVAWEPEKVALEIQGGIWRRGGGAHTGTGHLRDMEKSNLAQSLGWRVVQVIPEKLYTDTTLSTLRALLQPQAAKAS